MMSNETKIFSSLSPKQTKAILMLSSGLSPKCVAKNVGVAIGTLNNWKHQSPDFRNQLSNAQKLIYEDGIYRLNSLVLKAAESLNDAISDPSVATKDKLSAARTILQFSTQFTESAKPASAQVSREGDFMSRWGLK